MASCCCLDAIKASELPLGLFNIIDCKMNNILVIECTKRVWSKYKVDVERTLNVT